MADFSFVKDSSGSINGVWVRDPASAQDNTYVTTLFLRGGLPPEAISGTFRLVPNSHDGNGGFFVMLGMAMAPGERLPPVPAPKRWWQFWRTNKNRNIDDLLNLLRQRGLDLVSLPPEEGRDWIQSQIAAGRVVVSPDGIGPSRRVDGICLQGGSLDCLIWKFASHADAKKAAKDSGRVGESAGFLSLVNDHFVLHGEAPETVVQVYLSL